MVAWKDVETIAWDMQQNADYKKFIHRHLLSPAAKDDRQSVYSRAKASCPLTQGAFCAELVDLLRDAGKGPSLAPLPSIPAPPSAK